MVQLLWKQSGSFSNGQSQSYTHEPANALLGIYPNEGEKREYRKISIQVFLALLFILARKWPRSKCP